MYVIEQGKLHRQVESLPGLRKSLTMYKQQMLPISMAQTVFEAEFLPCCTLLGCAYIDGQGAQTLGLQLRLCKVADVAQEAQ